MSSFFHPTFGKGSNDEKTIKLEKYAPSGESFAHVTVEGLTSIIIPAHFNSYPLFHQTGNCIGSIRWHTNEETPYEIILVINGNTGIGFKEEEYKNSYADKIIQNEENLGYAKAVNKGIRVASGQYIAILNNDVQVYSRWLSDLQDALKAGLDLVMATPMYGKPFARAKEAKELRDATEGPIQDTFEDFNDFSCVLTTKSLFDEIGLFDEEFYMYGEDLDLLRRMDKFGKKHASTKRVNTHHIIGSTSSGFDETPDIMNKSKELLREKWGY